MKGPIKRTEEAIDSANYRIQATLDRVEGAAIMGLVAFAAITLVAVAALLVAAAAVESK